MTHSITIEQNSSVNIDRLAAQRQLYSTAKTYLSLVFILSVPLMIFLSIVVLIMKSSILTTWGVKPLDLSWFLVMSSFFVLILIETWLLPLINKQKHIAARIQEVFDTDVLALPWNHMAGDKPDPEIIKKYADLYLTKHGNEQGLKNWYSSILEDIPLEAGRICCQRSNFSWDATLRMDYVHWLRNIIIFIALATLALLTILNYPIREYWTSGIATVMPAIVVLVQQIRDHNNAISNLSRFKTKTEDLWKKLLETNNNTEVESRQLQDELFNMRKSNPLIFDWIYNRSKIGQESEMYYSTDHSVKEYLKNSESINKK